MSRKHLAKGALLHPVRDGAILFLSMDYCPFAHRVNLVLEAKEIKFDLVNCNLEDKPQFLLERNPRGRVPTIERNGQVLRESEVICNLLEDWYPEIPLWPKDPYLKAKDRVVVTEFSKVIPPFYKLLLLHVRGRDNEEADSEHVQGFSTHITHYADELKTRGTRFFGGNDKPRMVDYLCWPWFEKATFVDRMKEVVDSIPVLKAYVHEMLQQKVVKDNLVKQEHYLRFIKSFADGKRIYDVYV